jgi:hypothetical protein
MYANDCRLACERALDLVSPDVHAKIRELQQQATGEALPDQGAFDEGVRALAARTPAHYDHATAHMPAVQTYVRVLKEQRTTLVTLLDSSLDRMRSLYDGARRWNELQGQVAVLRTRVQEDAGAIRDLRAQLARLEEQKQEQEEAGSISSKCSRRTSGSAGSSRQPCPAPRWSRSHRLSTTAVGVGVGAAVLSRNCMWF